MDPIDWGNKFVKNLESLRSGGGAFERLTKAGLRTVTGVILYHFHVFGEPVPSEIVRGLGDKKFSLIPGLEKLQYAAETARERQRDPRTEMFDVRLGKARDTAGNSFWPFQNKLVKTLADASMAFPMIGSLALGHSTAMIGDARQTLERDRGKNLLAVLRAGAKANGVTLSPMELAELADAAHPNKNSDILHRKRSLQRYFARDDVRKHESWFLKIFEELLRQLRDAGRQV